MSGLENTIPKPKPGLFDGIQMLLFVVACTGFVIWATCEVPLYVLSEQPIVTWGGLLIGTMLIATGLLRGERFTRSSIKNALSLIAAGVVSLLLLTVFRGMDHLAIIVLAGVVCVVASVVLVVVEKGRRFIAAGVQIFLLLYTWGLVPLWAMAVADSWL